MIRNVIMNCFDVMAKLIMASNLAVCNPRRLLVFVIQALSEDARVSVSQSLIGINCTSALSRRYRSMLSGPWYLMLLKSRPSISDAAAVCRHASHVGSRPGRQMALALLRSVMAPNRHGTRMWVRVKAMQTSFPQSDGVERNWSDNLFSFISYIFTKPLDSKKKCRYAIQ